MGKFIIRLDDASTNLNIEKWLKMESLLDKYHIKPIVGVIPNNRDPKLLKYKSYPTIWEKIRSWDKKGWTIALHGYDHVFITNCGGLNPVNKRSEFAGVELGLQKKKIREGIEILWKENIYPTVFFAPAHTFDQNTLVALREDSDIRIISDTIATNMYYKDEFYFIPQQAGSVRKLPFKLSTFCYHPNVMTDGDFLKLERFLISNNKKSVSIQELEISKRKLNLLDKICKFIYFKIR